MRSLSRLRTVTCASKFLQQLCVFESSVESGAAAECLRRAASFGAETNSCSFAVFERTLPKIASFMGQRYLSGATQALDSAISTKAEPDGSTGWKYLVKIYTGDLRGAGSNAAVSITLEGEGARQQSMMVSHSSPDEEELTGELFKRATTNECTFVATEDLGNLKTLSVRRDKVRIALQRVCWKRYLSVSRFFRHDVDDDTSP